MLSDLYQHPTTNLLPFIDVMVEGSSYALNEEVLLSSRLFPIAYADDDVGSISRSRPGARTALFDARVDGMRRAVSAMDPLQVLLLCGAVRSLLLPHLTASTSMDST